MEFIWDGNIFSETSYKPMQRENDFGGRKYFFETSIISKFLWSEDL